TETDSATSAKFWAKGDSIFGTFVAPDGDYGLMIGKQEGDHVQLNRFTGWQANVLDMKREAGNWSGKYYARTNPPESFTLQPRVTATKEIPGEPKTKMKDLKKPFVFSGVTITGDTLTNLDQRFKGKMLIIDIMGTWCHNCMDEAPLLQKLYKEFNADGLEIIGLSFELKNDPALARKNLMLYQERYGINFPLLFCGTTDEENVKARLRSQVDNFGAYPTTFFVDRKGVVQHIHVGFKGPGTGDEFQQEVQAFYDIVKKMTGRK
ncbi:MAG: TlpA family protein disulfide reductase, partial [Ignavibacteriales bacterium]|nr:TlpA family protein disulfide reductase [Ignavibacteriales bacterium]